MSKFFSITALTFLVLLFNTNAHSQQMQLKLAANASKVITNHTLWTLNATCTIQNKDKNRIVVGVLDNKGIVNGRNLSMGQAMSVTVHNHDAIAVSAEPGTKVTLQNMSSDPVQATCST